MSKLYEKYKILKSQNNSKLYLFKSGIFYIFLDDDAVKMSKLLNLKLVNLNQEILKCGFPVKTSEKYLNLIKLNNYEVDIIDSKSDIYCNSNDYIFNDMSKKFIKDISNIDYYNLSVSEAFELIKDITTRAKELEKYF